MQMRPVELAAALGGLGYSVTLRRLTDWRTKGLLPRLVKHARGRGRGSFNAWDQANLVEQAVEIYLLLEAGSNAQDVLIAIWLKDFAVDIRRVRETLLSRLRTFEVRMRRDDKKYGGRKNRLTRSADVNARQIARGTNLVASDVRDFAAEILLALFQNDFSVGKEINSQILTSAVNNLFGEPTKRRRRKRVEPQQVEAGFELLRIILSIHGRQSLIKSATDEDMIEARDSWKWLVDLPGQFLGWFSKMSGKAPSPPRHVVQRLSVQLAPIGFLVFLAVVRDERFANKS